MKDTDSRIFGSWVAMVSVSLLMGFLFSIATGLIRVVTGGPLDFARQPLFFGGTVAVVFLVVLVWIRSQLNEESKG
jgi:hypothetical protein